MGGAAAIDAGENSALAALSIAIDMLLAGDCDLMVCAAGQRRMGLPAYEALALAGMLATRDDPAAPFDAEAHGYLARRGRRRAAPQATGRRPPRRRPDPRDHSRRRRRTCRVARRRPSGRRSSGRSAGGSPKPRDDIALVADGFAFPRKDADAIRTLAAVYGDDGRGGSRCGSVRSSGKWDIWPGRRAWPRSSRRSSRSSAAKSTGTVNLRTPSPVMAEAGVVTAATGRAPLGTTSDGRRLAAFLLWPRPGARRRSWNGRRSGWRGRDNGRVAAGGSSRRLPSPPPLPPAPTHGGSAAWAPPRRMNWLLGWPRPIRRHCGPSRRRPVSNRPTVPGWRSSPPTWICA